MGEWTGKWKSGYRLKCKCECKKEDGAEIYEQTFDADHIDSMKHDGETRALKVYQCEKCIEKFGKEIQIPR